MIFLKIFYFITVFSVFLNVYSFINFAIFYSFLIPQTTFFRASSTYFKFYQRNATIFHRSKSISIMYYWINIKEYQKMGKNRFFTLFWKRFVDGTHFLFFNIAQFFKDISIAYYVFYKLFSLGIFLNNSFSVCLSVCRTCYSSCKNRSICLKFSSFLYIYYRLYPLENCLYAWQFYVQRLKKVSIHITS